MHAPRRVHLAFIGAPPPPPLAAPAAEIPPLSLPGSGCGDNGSRTERASHRVGERSNSVQVQGASYPEQQDAQLDRGCSTAEGRHEAGQGAVVARERKAGCRGDGDSSSSSGGGDHEGTEEVPCTVVSGCQRWRVVAHMPLAARDIKQPGGDVGNAEEEGVRAEGDHDRAEEDGGSVEDEQCTETDTGTGSCAGTWHTALPPSNTAATAATAEGEAATPSTPSACSLTVPSAREQRSDAEVLRLLTVCAGDSGERGGSCESYDGSTGDCSSGNARKRARQLSQEGEEKQQQQTQQHQLTMLQPQQQHKQHKQQQQRRHWRGVMEGVEPQWIPRPPPLPSPPSPRGAAVRDAAMATAAKGTSAGSPSSCGTMRLCHSSTSLSRISVVVVVSRPPATRRTVHTRDGRDAVLSTLDVADETADDVPVCLWDAWCRVAPQLHAGSMLVLHSVHVRVYQGSLQLSPGRGSHILPIHSTHVHSHSYAQAPTASAPERLAVLDPFPDLRARVWALAGWAKRVVPHLYCFNRLSPSLSTAAASIGASPHGVGSCPVEPRLQSLSLFLRTRGTGCWQVLCRLCSTRVANEAAGVVYGCLRCGGVSCTGPHATFAPTSASQAGAMSCPTCIDRGGSQDGFAHGWLLPTFVLTVADTGDDSTCARVRLPRTVATKVFLPHAHRATQADADAVMARIRDGMFVNSAMAITCLPLSLHASDAPQHAGPSTSLAAEGTAASSPAVLTAVDAAALPFALPISAQ